MYIYEDLDLPGNGTPSAVVEITLWGSGQPIAGRHVPTGKLIVGTKHITPDSQGIWQADLYPNSEILPENTTYRIERTIGCETIISFVSVPASGGPYEAFTIEDDPMNAIAPSVLSAHASDLSLHGGGIEVDFAELTSGSVTVTGSSVEAQLVGALQLEIPDLARPVYLFFDGILTMPSAGVTGDATVGFANRNAEVTPNKIFTFYIIGGKPTYQIATTLTRSVSSFARLPAHSAGVWGFYASRIQSPYTITIIGNALQRATVRAVAA